jgi:hypothetical protein
MKQEDGKLEASPGYTAIPFLKTNKNIGGNVTGRI